jgi:hypothetical protein
LAREARGLRSLFTNIAGNWVPRSQNAIADELSRGGMPAACQGSEQQTGSEFRAIQARPKPQRQKQWVWPKKFNLRSKSHVELACLFVLDTRVADERERCFLNGVHWRPSLTQKQVGMLGALVAKARKARAAKGEVAQ